MRFGTSDAMAQGVVDMFNAKNNGLDNAEPRTPESTTPTSFHQWCEGSLKPGHQRSVKGYLDEVTAVAAAPVIEKYTGVLASRRRWQGRRGR